MITADSGPCNLFREYVQSKKGEADRIDNAALALPVLAEDVVLARKKIQARVRERPEAIEA